MTAIEFLRTKGIMENDCTKWIITWKNGKKVDLVELMEEYAKQKEDFANVIGGFEPSEERLKQLSKEYSEEYYKPITEWDGEDTKEAYMAGYKQALQDIKEAQK